MVFLAVACAVMQVAHSDLFVQVPQEEWQVSQRPVLFSKYLAEQGQELLVRVRDRLLSQLVQRVEDEVQALHL